jgi:hypothetical protein
MKCKMSKESGKKKLNIAKQGKQSKERKLSD